MRGFTTPRPEPTRSRHPQILSGFTIVELLIVVVVIAILAAVTLVAYNGITANARDSALKGDLTTGAKQLKLAKVDDGTFPSTKPNYLGDTLQYTGGGNSFCITASRDGRAFHMTETSSIQDGACPGHTVAGGGGGGSEIAANSPIQNVIQAQCQDLPVFNGSNDNAIRTVTDNRGGTTRTYEIAKLADNNCWMLTNLKLGSTSGSITLTPADSDVESNFTLPQLVTTGSISYDDPGAYGPVPGDTGAGNKNYGYLYNFAEATAGETQTSLTAGNAQYSIFPANWRLPTGGSLSSDFGQLDVAFGGTGNSVWSGEVNIAQWQPSGPLNGSFSGRWYDGFDDQGYSGLLWSASPYPGWSLTAFYANFGPGSVAPGADDFARHNGIWVRCLLN